MTILTGVTLNTFTDLYAFVKERSLEQLLSDVEKNYNYEIFYARYRDARLKSLRKIRPAQYYAHRYLSGNVFLSRIIDALPLGLPKGYFEERPLEWVHKHVAPAPYSAISGVPATFRQAVVDIKEHIETYKTIFDSLADDLSKKTLFVVLLARLTNDPSLYTSEEGIYQSQVQPCFDTAVVKSLPADAVYVDCGAYNGDTAKLYVKTYAKYKKMHLFEPDPGFAAECEKNLKGYHDIVIHKEAVSDVVSKGLFAYANDGLDRMRLTESPSGAALPATTLDEKIKEKIDYIKMDIEGAEPAALRGAVRHLKNDAPTLAINVYHKIGDIRECFEIIRAAHPSYRFYFRHYNHSFIKDVLYAI